MGIIGLDGRPLDASNEIPDSELHDETAAAAEAAGAEAKDVDSVDDLGVRYFYPLDFEKEELRGQRVTEKVRTQTRKEVMKRERQFERLMARPATKGELENAFQNTVAPIGRQAQSLTFQFIALRRILQEKLGITEEDIQKETAKVIATYRKEAAEQAAELSKRGLTEAQGMNDAATQSAESDRHG